MPCGHPPDDETPAARSAGRHQCRAARRPDRWRSRPGPPWPNRRRSWPGAPARRRSRRTPPASPPGRPHRGGQMGEQTDLSDVVGVHDGHRVCGVRLGAGLVAQDPERQHGGADRTVFGTISRPADRGRRGRRRRTRSCAPRRHPLCAPRRSGRRGGRRPGPPAPPSPPASRRASSTPISLRPPKITTGPATVSSTAAIIPCASVGVDGETRRPGSPVTRWRFSPNATWRC